jgi:hypothetical protein
MDSVKPGREPHEEAQGFADRSYDVAIAQVVPRDVGFAQKHKALEGRVPTHTLISESETSAAQYSVSELTHPRPVGFIRGVARAICVPPCPTTLATRPMPMKTRWRLPRGQDVLLTKSAAFDDRGTLGRSTGACR